ncbi:hypothetical protein [Haliangium sp.]|uniref:hypothetical protein n=1 Tax=Haliangium sp. TaxID=2663208 RepID=UPI003D0ED81D
MSVEQRLLDSMVGEVCWHVSAGGVTSPSFVLAMGAKVPRTRPLKNPAQPEEFRLNRGSVELLVWSSWRLQDNDDVLATSDQCANGVAKLKSLIGLTLEAVRCAPPAWDLWLEYSSGRQLVTFSDHLEPGASIASNWELWIAGTHIIAGPGTSLVEASTST